MPARNERTSKRVAALAAKILRKGIVGCCGHCGNPFVILDGVTEKDIRSLAASSLTQALDRKKVSRGRSHK